MSKKNKEEKEKNIRAVYNDDTVRVYQAYNERIANEAVKLNTFGENFKMGRMTWIKPSFLWMMYRCGWATKPNQERVLAIDIKREAFEYIVKNTVVSSFDESDFATNEEWKEAVENSNLRVQWDPERDIHGNPLEHRSIQLGIRGDMVEKYVNDWIVNITDITDEVVKIREAIKADEFTADMLPKEELYTLN